MTTRSTPSLLGLTIAPAGLGGILHLCAGVSPATAVALTVPSLAATVAVALIRHLPAIMRERSEAALRAAAIADQISARDAGLLLGHAACAPEAAEDKGTGKQRRPGRARRRRPPHPSQRATR